MSIHTFPVIYDELIYGKLLFLIDCNEKPALQLTTYLFELSQPKSRFSCWTYTDYDTSADFYFAMGQHQFTQLLVRQELHTLQEQKKILNVFWSELTKYFKKGPFVLIDNYFTSILSLLLFFKRFTFFLAIVIFFCMC